MRSDLREGGADPYDLTFAYNAEELNPVTHLTYLRARYYAPEHASFITKDSVLGDTSRINSQNRYSFAEADPINNADPTGHVIGNSSYERQVESAGSINEIYNFYAGTTLQNAQRVATSAFYSKLNYARGVDYRSLSAINSISQVSQATANAYINQGAQAALSVGQTWGCTSTGRFVNAAINTFAANVNATKTTVNRQIANVKANKQYQYQQYQAYLAWLAYQAYLAEQQRMAEEQAALQPRSGESYTSYLRRINNVPSSYSNNYVLTNYGSSQGQNRFYGQSSFGNISISMQTRARN